jgi:hypothetical protein
MFKYLRMFIQRLIGKFQGVQVVTTDLRIPAIPYDENGQNVFVPTVAIVDVDGKITGYLPLAAEDNGDGTASIKVTN